MIILRSHPIKDSPSIQGMQQMDLRVEVEGETPDKAMGMLLAGLTVAVGKLMSEHPKDCLNCPGYKFAQILDWHIKSIQDEAKTLLGAQNEIET